MANYPQELAQNAVCQSHTGHMTGLWFLPFRLNTNECMNNPSGRTMALELTPPLTEISTRNISLGVKAAGA